MEIGLAVVFVIALVIFGYIGHQSDLRRALVALVGVLYGSLLVMFWAQPWSAALAGRLGADVVTTQTAVSLATFLVTALVVGYGGGLLLPPSKERPSLQGRLVTMALGMLSGALIVSFVLYYLTQGNPALRQSLQQNLLGRALIAGPPWLFLGVALAVAVAALVRMVVLSIRRRGAAPTPAPAPLPAAESAPAAPAAPPEPQAPARADRGS
jgi:hypothetical protein